MNLSRGGGRAALRRAACLPGTPAPSRPSCFLGIVRASAEAHSCWGARENCNASQKLQALQGFRRPPNEPLTNQCDSDMCALTVGTLGLWVWETRRYLINQLSLTTHSKGPSLRRTFGQREGSAQTRCGTASCFGRLHSLGMRPGQSSGQAERRDRVPRPVSSA